jgi:HEAT repeat protein
MWIDSDHEEGINGLIEALQDPDIAVRLSAAEVLETVKPTTKKAQEALKEALNDPVEAVRIAVQVVLATIEKDRDDIDPQKDHILTGGDQ